VRRLKIVFNHDSAADRPISMKFSVGKQFFHRISAMGHIPAFCFPSAVWASANGSCRIASDTLVVSETASRKCSGGRASLKLPRYGWEVGTNAEGSWIEAP